MSSNQYNIQRILALADIYFRLTGKSAGAMSGVDMAEFYAYITQCSSPDELHKLIANKINFERAAREEFEEAHPGGWCMLPPAQRII